MLRKHRDSTAGHENERRTRWSSNTYFNLALMSYTLGSEKARYGSRVFLNSNLGGAAAILLLAFAILVRIPIMFMEMSLGQFSGKAGMSFWDICPIARGVGYASMITFFWYQVTYHTSCTYALYYMILPIKNMTVFDCSPSWTKFNCYTYAQNVTQYQACIDRYDVEFCRNVDWQHAAKQFFFYYVLKIDETAHSYMIREELVLYAFITCTLAFLVNIHGTSSIEKTLWIFHVLPGMQLFLLLFSAAVDMGGMKGLFSAMQPNLQVFFNFKTWARCFVLSMLSSGLGFGAYTAMGAQSPFRSPIYLKTISMSALDCVGVFIYTSLLSCYLGIIQYNTKRIFNLTSETSEPILWSIIPQSFFHLSKKHDATSTMWFFMFYSHLFFIGFRCLVIMINIDCEKVYDYYPRARDHRSLTAFCIIITQFVFSLLAYTESGYPIFRCIERAMVFSVTPILCMCEVFAIVYFYGVTHFLDDSHFMLGIKAPPYWTVFYVFLPLIILISLIYDGRWSITPVYPGMGFLYSQMVIVALFPTIIVVYAIVYAITKKKHILNSAPGWGCCIVPLRKSRQMFAAHSMTKEYMYRQDRKRDRFQFEDSDLSSD